MENYWRWFFMFWIMGTVAGIGIGLLIADLAF
jgi:hypothetical protein